jgi:2-polyprenyl-6-methoxyphenol hydroxylase-like FAD-dependent oxidoreductase
LNERRILVVGAGPTGLMLAAELLRHGHRPLLIEKEPTPSTLSRAIVVHARTLEILEIHGLAGQLVEAGVRLGRVNLWAGGQVAVDVSFQDLPTAYPFLLSIPQDQTEALLRQRVLELGGEITSGVELLSFQAHPDFVDVKLSDRELRVDWLVGCDGAHSAVRHGLDLPFQGHAYEEKLVLADLAWEVPLPRDTLSTFFHEDGLLACFPLADPTCPTRFRLIATETDTDVPADLALFRRLIERRTPLPAQIREVRWLARFRIHARQVSRYRAGRVLLAGDAAHIHSPAGGQGMNLGLQDAHNLGWKLARVQEGGPARLLDSYELERHPIAEQVLRATDAATRIGTLTNPVARRLRDSVASLLSRWPLVTDRIVRAVAEVDVAYPSSPIVLQDAAGTGPRAGERPAGLPVDKAHVLLLLQGPALDEAGKRRLRLCEILARQLGPHVVLGTAPSPLGVPADGVAVVRPDGYLGLKLAPADPERLLQWLETTLAI